jgi:hypothetical protein
MLIIKINHEIKKINKLMMSILKMKIVIKMENIKINGDYNNELNIIY